ncbi:MAG: methyltransferase domain-containing protein, partial [Burkholderiales bacterium]|nr:methyltransferase domain-containing protein [Burkholderiales bacterium]
MVNHCTLCGSIDIEFALRFPDVSGKLIDLYTCVQCASLIPQFESNDSDDALGQQVRFHEDWWQDSLADDLDRSLRNMAGVVSQLQPVLGSPQDAGGAVVEVGCGRGTMLRALTDAGYSTLGCEPSARLSELARTHYGIPQEVLFQMTADAFLNGPVSQLSQPPRAVVLWHVLEHLPEPLSLLFRIHDVLPCGGHLILQLPLLHQPYVYPEHYFFVSETSVIYLASRCGFEVVSLECDQDNFFLTACLRRSASISGAVANSSALSNHTSPVANAILLRDRSIVEKHDLLDERWSAMQSMEAMIRERDEAISGQARMLDERWSAMQSMEAMIRERDEAISGQARMLDERWSAMQSMEAMIRERDEAISGQARMLDERWSAMQSMEA